MVEWKYDGIRAQVVKRARPGVGVVARRGTGDAIAFPKIVAEAQLLPDGSVLDGEILVWTGGRPAPFALLQQRIGRKTLSRKVLSDAPVRFLAYDVLEHQGRDVRALPQRERRSPPRVAGRPCGMLLSPVLEAASWAEHGELRREAALARRRRLHAQAPRGGLRRGADQGERRLVEVEDRSDERRLRCSSMPSAATAGGRASTPTTPSRSGIARRTTPPKRRPWWRRSPGAEPPEPGALQLVPFAKAYSGLSDEEFRRVDADIRRTTLEKFGPVRSVRPTMMFELGFEGINRSTRHKSGIAVRFPRMLRIRDDKPLHEADTLQALETLLPAS